ncbi:hypothetical protein [Streptomyces cavernicola]|uniref:Secreted protein n=1 Tax=Streptomyces cavernicola TaxID=3043613 RepID=A0ABT6SEN9_9ACTN|nr:hypothetical protein [Streptomyces sp. B-S-A6]MDI3406615.1 hypothetical protein [Streptomyces sp. B-S-A6]
MRSGHKIMTGFVAVLFALLIVIVGLCVEWPLWSWPAAFGLLAVGTAVALALFRQKPPLIPYEHQLEPEAPLPPVERWECVIRNVSLPSISEDYDFQFTATVRWIPQDASDDAPGINAGGLAVDAVLERARRITQQESPHRSSLVQHRLNGELATMQLDESCRVAAMAERVQLSLSEPDRERLEKLATVRKNEAVWEHERKWEQSKRAYLGDDVLRTPGSAVVWWLAKNEEKVDKTVADIGLLAELSSAANDQPVPQGFHRFVPGLAASEPQTAGEESTSWPSAPRSPHEYADFVVGNCGLDEDDPRRLLFIERMAKAAEAAGLDEIRDALLRQVDDFAPPQDADAPEPPEDMRDEDEEFGH